jgi:CBS domain-containing protein
MAGPTVGDVMVRMPKTLPADVTVADARASLERASVKVLLLVDGERFCGPVTAIPADARPEEPARRYLDETLPVAGEEMPAAAALELLERRASGRIVVLDGERLTGLVCLTADGERFCGRPDASA